MKKIYIVFMFGFIFCVTACSDFIDDKPISTLSTNLYWKTTGDISSARAAMYKSFADAMNSNYFRWGELRGGTWEEAHDGQGIQELVDHAITETNSACNWSDLYKTINKANLIIKHVPGMFGVDAGIQQKAIGEAFGMRALSYFYCVRVWGAVPLFTEAVEYYDKSLMKPRTSADSILVQIESDLKRALEFLPAMSSSDNTRYYMTQLGVYAVMMDVYAWEHKYQQVVDLWEKNLNVMPSNIFAFKDYVSTEITPENITKWRSAFMDGTNDKELALTVKYDYATDGTYNSTKSFFWHSGMQCMITAKTIALFDQNKDIRYLGTVRPQNDDIKPYKLEKFYDWGFCDGSAHEGDYSDNDLIMYRYTDLMLLYAEALNQVGRNSDAISYVNKVRLRAGLDALPSTLSQQEIANAILDERHLELIGEGKYWFDLVRTGNASLVGCPAGKILFPIHRDHLNQNPNLTQN